MIPKPATELSSAEAPNDGRSAGAPIWILAVGAGIGVASVYYTQPILPLIQRAFDASTERVALVPVVTQAGYAAGMLFLAPLGDLVDRRQLIIVKSTVLVAALVLSALSPRLPALLVAGIMIGALGNLGQDFIPLASHLAPEAKRGKMVGIVTTGLMTGILLSRSVSGIVADTRSVVGIMIAETSFNRHGDGRHPGMWVNRHICHRLHRLTVCVEQIQEPKKV